VANAQGNPAVAERLERAFERLTPNMNQGGLCGLTADRQSRFNRNADYLAFTNAFTKFLAVVHGMFIK